MPKKKNGNKKTATQKNLIEVQNEGTEAQVVEADLATGERPAAEKPKKSGKKDKTSKKKKNGFFKRMRSYFCDLKNELKKVVWPTKKRLIHSTLVVLAMVAIICIFVCVLDLLFNGAISMLFGKLS